jgi:hypothetical protein
VQAVVDEVVAEDRSEAIDHQFNRVIGDGVKDRVHRQMRPTWIPGSAV